MLGLSALAFAMAALPIEINYKEAIANEQKLIAQSPLAERGLHKQKLAKLFYKDQETEKAFEVFLEALSEAEVLPAQKITEEEQRLYTQALQAYLERSPSTKPLEQAKSIKQKYAPIIAAQPAYHHLGYIVAAAYANLEKFSEYFDLFYQSYRSLPEHYLAYKGKAALHAQLLARRRTVAEK